MDFREKIKDAEQLKCEQMMDDMYKDVKSYISNSEFSIWFKTFLREQKNLEQSNLKLLVDEKSHENVGMNPPWCYRK